MMLINVELMFVRILRSSELMVSVELVQIGKGVKVVKVNLVDLTLVAQVRNF